jgi:hypothetical protein
MSMHEHMKPGIYIDDKGAIWRKSASHNWTVNGQSWRPFPKSLTTLTTIGDDSMPANPEVIVGSLREAEEVINELSRIIELYNSATVADLYDLVDISGKFTDQKWGWTDMSIAAVNRVKEGYLLILPKLESLDKR